MNELINNDTESDKVKTAAKYIKFSPRRFAAVAVSFILLLYSAAVLIIAKHSSEFAEMYSITFGKSLRSLLAVISGVFPFSLSETIVILFVPAAAVTLVRAVVLKTVYGIKGAVKKWLVLLLCAVSLVAFLFVNAFGVCYYRTRIADSIGLDVSDITESDVETAAIISLDMTSALGENVLRFPDGSTKMPYGFDTMCDRIYYGYENIFSDMPKYVSVKPVSLSELWTYTHISGMYFPITGESNINVSYPDYTLAFSAAHEMAHQLGFAFEDEANFLAFLACLYSDDEYLQYCAFMNASEYLVGDLPAQTAVGLYSSADLRIWQEHLSFTAFSKKYSNSAVTAVSSAVNDGYLKVNGIEDGAESYQNVTLYITAYFKNVFPYMFSD